MRQLTGMERTRAVSMAQQESVSLAQMLKARQEAHEKDMMLLSNKAQLEAMEAMSGLETARLRGTAASQGAEEVLSRLSRPMESSDNISQGKAANRVCLMPLSLLAQRVGPIHSLPLALHLTHQPGVKVL